MVSTGLFTVMGAGMMYITHHLPTLPIAQQVFYDLFLTGLIGGSITGSYLKDTSLLLSPQRQAQLESKLEQEKAQTLELRKKLAQIDPLSKDLER